jgi:predicted Fe-Mo cluster-binding NifX family protein
MVCIPCEDPGGASGKLASSFETADVFDYWEIGDDGTACHAAQNRTCHGSFCVEPVEAIHRRRADALVVTSIAPATLAAFSALGVKVFRAESPTVQNALRSLAAGTLKQMGVRKESG